MRTLALLLVASVVTATVYPGESSQWQIGSGDEHGVEPIPSDALDCSPTSVAVLSFGGTGGNAYVEIIFTGNIGVYGLVSPSGGPIQVFVDGAFAFAFDEQLQTGAGPVHCAYMGTWFSPPEIDTSTAHTLRYKFGAHLTSVYHNHTTCIFRLTAVNHRHRCAVPHPSPSHRVEAYNSTSDLPYRHYMFVCRFGPGQSGSLRSGFVVAETEGNACTECCVPRGGACA
ncbi:hypothetical protein EXIGLDRAFT_408617 [Exidia glandulosa HHB12029]|uniref:Uncharacterized protein n=1 Tax=Exidia glandulosa HHB12029 TaxID=1314781 RepID=A0A165KRD6_EXIGL|nr:hypothetical protein EXIGLDRAFT_408617 [Exidia glandulosa HHB12029]